MILSNKRFLLISILTVSFVSSCGKKTNSPDIIETENEYTNQENTNQDLDKKESDKKESDKKESDKKEGDNGINNDNKFCTDLSDEKANPLGKYQWHLLNNGNTAFSTTLPKAGEDINVNSVLKNDCLSGNKVYVAIADSGLQISHPSLAPNVDNKPNVSKTWSLNFRSNGLSPNDPSPIDGDEPDHGTMVSGIIGMRSNLGFGGSGVAPRAHLSGYNVISSGAQNFKNFLDSLGGSDASKGNDIFSMSFGMNNTRQIKEDNPTTKASVAAFKSGTTTLRNGKGALYVKAAGNGFSSMGMFSGSSCDDAKKLNLSCQNSSMNFENTLAEVITVGAINSQGVKSSYSTTGSSLWISAPGGEFGKNKEWVEKNYKTINEVMDWTKIRATAADPAIITTDVVGSKYGLSRNPDLKNKEDILKVGNPFNACEVDVNKDCNYTNSMNGTSSATPVTSGSIALILEANPNLTWRDVKYILAKTATKVDPNFNGVSINIAEGVSYQAEQGWVTNAAGFHFSNWYGFGRVNVADAVALAKNYNINLGEYIEKDWIPKIPSDFSQPVQAGDINGYESKLTVFNYNSLKIENIQIKVSLESKFIGDVALELTSPSGTKSIVWHAANAFSSNGNLVGMQIQSNAFFGEDSKGEWKLKVINTGIHKKEATFKGWQLKVTGHQ